jgi:hypothetical protein
MEPAMTDKAEMTPLKFNPGEMDQGLTSFV